MKATVVGDNMIWTHICVQWCESWAGNFYTPRAWFNHPSAGERMKFRLLAA
jgi:hypothetical protein